MEMILDGSCDLLEYYGDSPEVAGMVLPGDVRKTLELLDDQSVQCVVTSPPYWSLRDYGIDGQIGLTESMYSYIEELFAIMSSDEFKKGNITPFCISILLLQITPSSAILYTNQSTAGVHLPRAKRYVGSG